VIERLGIYFDLPAPDYHADPALGSTDIKRLLASGADYWWSSPLNPNKEERSTPSLEFGKAVHKLVFEGHQAFAAKYVRRPPDIARLTEKKKLELFPNNETVLDEDDFDRIIISGELIARNSELATAFEGGMPEVSVFWLTPTSDAGPVRCKARFDYLKVRGIGDLKSIRNNYGRPFAEACKRAIIDYRYDLQAAHYLEGRGEFRNLIAHGLVYGDHDPEWLARCAASPTFAWQWVFYQAEGAPITWSRSLSPGNPILDIAFRDRTHALGVYCEFRDAFPAGEMWTLQEPVTELEIDEMPRWYR